MIGVAASGEFQSEGDLGIKIKLEAPADVDELKEAGERIALRNRQRAKRVWVWVYGHDMDIDGPAACVSYVGDGEEGAVTDFTDPAALALYYGLKNMEA